MNSPENSALIGSKRGTMSLLEFSQRVAAGDVENRSSPQRRSSVSRIGRVEEKEQVAVSPFESILACRPLGVGFVDRVGERAVGRLPVVLLAARNDDGGRHIAGDVERRAAHVQQAV